MTVTRQARDRTFCGAYVLARSEQFLAPLGLIAGRRPAVLGQACRSHEAVRAYRSMCRQPDLARGLAIFTRYAKIRTPTRLT